MQISSNNLLAGLAQPFSFSMDTPFKKGSAREAPLTRMLGHVISNPKLARIQPGDRRNPAITRACNLATLVAQTLLTLDPKQREEAMTRIGGFNFTQQVLSFAKQCSNALDTTEAIRFSLALHFLHGLMDDAANNSSVNADGYRGFARYFKNIQRTRQGAARASGLGGLGQVKKTTTPAVTKSKAPAAPQGSSGWYAAQAAANAMARQQQEAQQQQDAQMLLHGDPVGSTSVCKRWTPSNPCYPSPEETDLQLIKFQADACRAGVDLRPVSFLQQDKYIGIRMKFREVFGRDPTNSEANYFGRMKWCQNAQGQGEALTQKMIRCREAIERGYSFTVALRPTEGNPFGITPDDFAYRDYGTDVGDALNKAANAAFDFLGKAAQFVSDILCKGFKALLGDQVGGVICDIIDFMTRALVSGIATVIDVIIESLKGTVEFVRLMLQGKVEDAFKALLQSMGRVLFSLAAPMMVPVLMADKGQGRSMSQAFAELKVRADRVTAREPLWPLMVIISVVGVFSVVGGNVLGAVTGVITAVAPMAATFISEPLLRLPELASSSLEEIETSIIKFVKFIVLIVNGAFAIKDLVSKFRGQMMAYFKKATAGSLTGGANANAAQRIKYVLEKLSAGFQVLSNAFSKFNVKDMTEAAGPLLTLIPDLLLAILPDDAKESVPTLTEWKDAVAKSTANVNEQEATIRAGAQDLFKTFSLDTKVSFIKEGVKEMPANNVAQVTAQMIAQQFRNQSTYPAFKAQLRAELLKA